MDDFLPALLATGVAVVVTGMELITDKYPRTFPFVCRCKSFYAYVFIYGIIAALVMLFVDYLVATKAITLEGPMIGNIWAQAVAIGVAIKAFLHIRLVTVSVGTQSIPIGVETVVLLFEPWLLRDIELCHFDSVRQFIDPKVARHSDLVTVKQKVLANVPKSFSTAEKVSFKDDIANATTVVEVMEMFLSFVGSRTFDRVFP